MEESARTLLVQLFRDIPDPRMVGKISHKLHDILVITVCAVLCGLEHWTQIADYGKAHEAWFRTFLDLPNGIPSHDTFGKVLAALDPIAFEQRIQQWILAVFDSACRGKHIAIDGKTLRRSFDHASGKAAIHLIHAYVHENHAVFAQLKVDDKSNEITAIPSLLEMLELDEATVTIDAMGCQKEIARKIVDRPDHDGGSRMHANGQRQDEHRTSVLHQFAFGPTGTETGRPDPQSLAGGEPTALDAGRRLQRRPMPRTNRKRRRKSGSYPSDQPDPIEAGKDLQAGHPEQTSQSGLRQKPPPDLPGLQTRHRR